MLTQGQISCTDGKEIRWKPLKAEGSEFFIIPLNREEKKEVIVSVLKDITGKEYGFSAVSFSTDLSAGNSNEEEYIGQLYATFGKEPVDIVDKM